MNKWLFISDFDGTLTKKDFYWIIIDDYIGEAGVAYYHAWKAQQKIDYHFLNKIFAWHTFTEEERHALLNKVALSPGFGDFEAWLSDQGIEFKVLSAGAKIYIEQVFEEQGYGHVDVISNEGTYEEGHYKIIPDKKGWFYHDLFGVNKALVVEHYKASYEKVFFAGDSEPDLGAAMAADLCFAKDELAIMLEAKGHPYYKYETFEDILRQLKDLLNQ